MPADILGDLGSPAPSEGGGRPAAAPGAERARGDVALPAGGTTLRQAKGRRLTPLRPLLPVSVISVSSVREIPRTFLTESTENTERETSLERLPRLSASAPSGSPAADARQPAGCLPSSWATSGRPLRPKEEGGPAAATGAERSRGRRCPPGGRNDVTPSRRAAAHPPQPPFALSVISVSSVRENPPDFSHREHREHRAHREKPAVLSGEEGGPAAATGAERSRGRRCPPGGRNDVTPSRRAAAHPPQPPFAPLRDLRELRERNPPDFSYRAQRETSVPVPP
jgi:hypothetical protein